MCSSLLKRVISKMFIILSHTPVAPVAPLKTLEEEVNPIEWYDEFNYHSPISIAEGDFVQEDVAH